MPDIKVTDNLHNPVDSIKIDLTHLSSLVKYLKTDLLHLAVVPDFLALKDTPIGQAAVAKPLTFEATAQHKFQLGNTKPEIDVTPEARATIRVNVTPSANIFDDDHFQAPAKVPPGSGYLSVAFEGSLDLGVSGSEGDLTFGLDRTASVELGYCKVFPLTPSAPTMGDALGQALSSFVIPADLSDLDLLGQNDIATVSGTGSLKISGGVSVNAIPNPLASVNLPLGAGGIAIKAGPAAGLSAAYTLSGSYQVRALRKDAAIVELSFLKESGTSLKVDLSASAGIKTSFGDTDLVASVLGAISTDDPTKNQKLLSDLTPPELKALADALKDSLNHSLQASLDVVLSALTDNDVAFQYEVQPALLSPAAALAVHKALDGDLTGLTELEAGKQPGGILAPGLKMLNSVFSEMNKRRPAFRLNLLGILNFLSVSELIRNSEIITDQVTGDVTIKETITGNRINSITLLPDKQEALRKAIFDSVLITTTYVAGKSVALPEFSCQQVHFALNQNTNSQLMGDYLRWFVALDLLEQNDAAVILAGFNDGGASTCILRSTFTDSDCRLMFLDPQGNLRDNNDYLEVGRQALRALLDPQHQDIDRYRYRLLDEKWSEARQLGAAGDLGPLVGLDIADPRVEYLIGDVLVIAEWADGMTKTGKLVLEMRNFVGNADPKMLAQNNEFKKKNDALQKATAGMIGNTKMRFDEPWGMVCLFWAGGSPATAYAKLSTQRLLVERGHSPAITAGADASSK
jgi:hypothetical protein